MAKLNNILSDAKNVAETVMDIFEKGSDIVKLFNGELLPIFSGAVQIVKDLLNGVESTVADEVKGQFDRFSKHLDVISDDVKRINEEIKKSMLDLSFTSKEENIRHQFRMYMEFVNAKPEFREVKKEQFLIQFSSSEGEKNLNLLYSLLVGDYSVKPLLETILTYEENSRRSVEEYCARLINLLCIGIIALVCHAAVSGNGEEEKLLKEWGDKTTTVQKRMSAAVEECIASFPSQAKSDCERLVGQNGDLNPQQLADALIEMLKKKYDWVSWSVRVYILNEGFFEKTTSEEIKGQHSFQVTGTKENTKIWVSYSDSPELLDKNLIQQLIQSQKKVAENLFEKLSGGCMVHTVKNGKDVACSTSFSDEQHYWEKHKNLHVCVHSA
uniref:Rapunzel 4 n=1 Tax=Oryzias sinensis TaxID=183150 RepID=A0A8C7YAQ2_9TELE